MPPQTRSEARQAPKSPKSPKSSKATSIPRNSKSPADMDFKTPPKIKEASKALSSPSSKTIAGATSSPASAKSSPRTPNAPKDPQTTSGIESGSPTPNKTFRMAKPSPTDVAKSASVSPNVTPSRSNSTSKLLERRIFSSKSPKGMKSLTSLTFSTPTKASPPFHSPKSGDGSPSLRSGTPSKRKRGSGTPKSGSSQSNTPTKRQRLDVSSPSHTLNSSVIPRSRARSSPAAATIPATGAEEKDELQEYPRTFQFTFIPTDPNADPGYDITTVCFVPESAMEKSPYFRRYLSPDKDFKEMTTLVINFPEEHPDVMMHILDWLKGGEIDPDIDDGMGKAVEYAEIFRAADLYLIQDLKEAIATIIGNMKKTSFVKIFKFFEFIARYKIIGDSCLKQIKTTMIPDLLIDLNEKRKSQLNDILTGADRSFHSMITNCWELAFERREEECQAREEMESARMDELSRMAQAIRKLERYEGRQDNEIIEWRKRLTRCDRIKVKQQERIAALKELLEENNIDIPFDVESDDEDYSEDYHSPTLLQTPTKIKKIRETDDVEVPVTEGAEDSHEELVGTPNTIQDIRDDSPAESPPAFVDPDQDSIIRNARIQDEEVGPGTPIKDATHPEMGFEPPEYDAVEDGNLPEDTMTSDDEEEPEQDDSDEA